MYLMGRIDDTYENGMYPLVKVYDIAKEDLQRCKRDEIIIYNLQDNTYYDYKNNRWENIPFFNRYNSQWDKATE